MRAPITGPGGKQKRQAGGRADRNDIEHRHAGRPEHVQEIDNAEPEIESKKK